jgi:Uma2 family endonuclease
MSHNPPHDVAVDLAQNAIADQLPEGWRVRVQSVITIDGSEPEPDIAVVRGPARRYAKAHPRSKDVAFLVEVADTTLTEDRDFKGPLYARARIPVYWIVNLREAKVEVYTQPKGRKAAATYHYRQDYETDQSVPLVIEGREVAQIPVRDLLP